MQTCYISWSEYSPNYCYIVLSYLYLLLIFHDRVAMEQVDLKLGLGFFIDIDKEGALRIDVDDVQSYRYGRLTRDMM